jgi:hypothetical protein
MAGINYYGVSVPPPALQDEEWEALRKARAMIPARSLPPTARRRKHQSGAVSFTSGEEDDVRGNAGIRPRREIFTEMFGASSSEENDNSSVSSFSSPPTPALPPNREKPRKPARPRAAAPPLPKATPRGASLGLDFDSQEAAAVAAAEAAARTGRAGEEEEEEDDDAPPGPDEAEEAPPGEEEDDPMNGGPQQQEDEEDDEPVPCVSPEVDMLLRELGVPDPKDKCYGCIWARADVHSVSYENYHSIVKLACEKNGLADRFELCRRISAAHDAQIAKKQNGFRRLDHRTGLPREDEPAVLRWTPATVYDHLYGDHTVDHGLRTTSRLYTTGEFIKHLKDNGSWVEVRVGKRRRHGRIVDAGRLVKVPTERGMKNYKMMVDVEEKLYKSRALNHASSGYGISGEAVYPLIEAEGARWTSVNVEQLYGISVNRASGSAGKGSTVSGTTAAHRTRSAGISKVAGGGGGRRPGSAF